MNHAIRRLNATEGKDIVSVAGQQVQRLTYKGMPVLSLPKIDQLHGKKTGTARQNFYRNRIRFIEGEDYFGITNQDVYGVTDCHAKGDKAYFLTESGYLLLAKSFADDLAWKVQRALVNSYFKTKIPDLPQPFRCDNTPGMGIIDKWFTAFCERPIPADKYLMTANAPVRIFSVPGRGECVAAIDVNRACGNGSSTASGAKVSPLVAKLLFKVTPPKGNHIRCEINAVRVADVPSFCICKRQTMAVRRFARLMADYAAGLAQTYVPLSAPNAPRQSELPFH